MDPLQLRKFFYQRESSGCIIYMGPFQPGAPLEVYCFPFEFDFLLIITIASIHNTSYGIDLA